MILFLADRRINNQMRCCDLADGGHKIFIHKAVEVSFKTTTEVNRAYFLKLIETSKTSRDEGDFIAAVQYGDEVITAPDTWSLSDGQKQIFTYNSERSA